MLGDCLAKLNDVVDPAHARKAEALVKAAVSYEPVEHLPLVVNFTPPDWPQFPLKQAFDDSEKMLLNELGQVMAGAAIRDDRINTIRANFGVGAVASMFGCEIFFSEENTMPWCRHLSDEDLDKIMDRGKVSIEDGLGRRVLETERFYLQAVSSYPNIAEAVRLFVSDTQGPFDTAHLVMGHKIYTEVYDSPERVHRLLDIVTDAIIGFTRAQAEILGGGLGDNVYPHTQAAARGIVRICEDSSINVSRQDYKQFCKPYNARLLRELGGGWIHYCGGGHQILDEVLSTPGLTALNFGNPERQNLVALYPRAREQKVAILGWHHGCGVPDKIDTGITLMDTALGVDDATAKLRAHLMCQPQGPAREGDRRA